MHRRNLLTWGASTIAISSLGGFPRDTDRVRRVGVSDANQISTAAVRLRNLAHLHGGENLWGAALAVASDGYLMLEQGSYGETTGIHLQKAVGHAEMCAGWLAFDAGRHETARSSSNEALSLARQTSDPVIETCALVNLAFQSNNLGMPRQALRFADAAERVAKGVVAKMEVVPNIQLAAAHARLGDRVATGNSIKQARNLLDRDADKATVEWCNFLTPEELDGVEGSCALRLGDARRAETLLERAIAAHTSRFARNLALYRVRLATAQLNGGAVEAAATSATSALDDLSGELASSIITTELHDFAQGVSRYRGIAEVDAFEHRYSLSEVGPSAQGRREH